MDVTIVEPLQSRREVMQRREFLGANALALAGGTLAVADNSGTAETQQAKQPNHLAAEVQMPFMRPGQLDSAGRKFPVVYVPFGLIEWHGRCDQSPRDPGQVC